VSLAVIDVQTAMIDEGIVLLCQLIDVQTAMIDDGIVPLCPWL